MSMKRIWAILGIFTLACLGWAVLGSSTKMRSDQFNREMHRQVSELWGGELSQVAPTISTHSPEHEVMKHGPHASDIDVIIELEHRRKGLLWYPTYRSTFTAEYTLLNSSTTTQQQTFHFQLPDPYATYDQFSCTVDGEDTFVPHPTQGIKIPVDVEPGAEHKVMIQYRTRGMYSWRYQPSSAQHRISNLTLDIQTNFENFDYPSDGSFSADLVTQRDDGMLLQWQTNDLITRRDIGIRTPQRLNPGPVITRIAFFAPVCLGFFFLLVAAITVIKNIAIHPMHYLFVAAGFGSFHVLLAYLVDVIPMAVAFSIGSLVSTCLTTAYLRAALGPSLPTSAAASGQVFYLVLFSFSFFLEGLTGLTVALGSVVTLAVLMRLTVHLDWEQVFGRSQARAPSRSSESQSQSASKPQSTHPTHHKSDQPRMLGSERTTSQPAITPTEASSPGDADKEADPSDQG